MREGQNTLYFLLRDLYVKCQRFLDSEADVTVEPADLGFCVCFRHDMDRFGDRDWDAFLRIEERCRVPATLFFLQSQFTRFGERIRGLDGQRYECALHSEAKPTPFCWSVFQLSRLLERGYARRLRRQARRFGKSVRPSLGHAPHAVNNYLPFQGWINWNVIENASLRAGFAYISDWRMPSRIAEGEEFLPPWPAYRRRRGADSVLVLPTCWDDKFFFYSYEDLHIRRLAGKQEAYRPRSAAVALESFLKQAQACRELDTPCVINIHPWHAACNGQPQFYELKERIIAWCEREGVPILRCRDLLAGIEVEAPMRLAEKG